MINVSKVSLYFMYIIDVERQLLNNVSIFWNTPSQTMLLDKSQETVSGQRLNEPR